MPPENNNNGWGEWKNHVLIELKSNTSDHTEMMNSIGLISQQLAGLQVKSGVWGLLGGIVPVGILVIFLLVRGV